MIPRNSEAAARRAHTIQLIHVAKRDLALDDDTYRAILRRVGSADSCSEMNTSSLISVLDYMKENGFQVKPKQRQIRTLAADDQSKKIRSLWLQMADAGVVRDRSEKALATFVNRLTGRDALQWLDSKQANVVIEALKKWQAREEVKGG